MNSHPREGSDKFQVEMRTRSLLLCLLVSIFALEASAQFTVRLGRDGGYRSGNYDGYWSPQYTPRNFQQEMARVRFANKTRGQIELYYLDRYDSWKWVESLDPGDAVKVDSPVGDVWIARGRGGEILQRIIVRPGAQTVEIRYAASYYDGHRYGPKKAKRFDLKFRNKTSRPVVVYCLQPWGEWVWIGRVSPYGGEMQVETYRDQEFRVLDYRGRKLKHFRADPDKARLTLD